MIEYAKIILPKIIAWKSLFGKELKKCLDWSEPDELFELQEWCYENFYEIYPDIISNTCGSGIRFIKIPKGIIQAVRNKKKYVFKKSPKSILNTG